MRFVDTHCHLNFEVFNQDFEQVLERAQENQVYRVIVPGLDLPSSRAAVFLAEKYSSIYAAVGIHPGSIDEFSEDQVGEISYLLSHPKVVAVGEIGLDYYHHEENKPQQQYLLNKMFELAVQSNKPVILHSRNALPDLIQSIQKVINSVNGTPLIGIFHAFEGDVNSALEVIRMGFLVGAGGPVTYKNASIKHELFSKIDLRNIVLETDAPFLSPQQLRGTRNEPGNIPIIAGKIAELMKCSVTDIADETTKNVKILFNWND